jgi:hypothetical protein
MNGPDDSDARRVRSLRDLPQAVAPPEGLWLRIAAEIEAPRKAVRRPPLLAAAAVLVALAVGTLAGHWLLPPSYVAQQPLNAVGSQSAAAGVSTPADALPVSFISDPRYLHQRALLLSGLAARLAALPPETQAKVRASLATLQQSMLDLQAALGRDPSNALLQELLVDTCQDEMRVLVSVNEAGQGAEQL